jgi:hypothetical protein
MPSLSPQMYQWACRSQSLGLPPVDQLPTEMPCGLQGKTGDRNSQHGRTSALRLNKNRLAPIPSHEGGPPSSGTTDSLIAFPVGDVYCDSWGVINEPTS